MLVPSLLVALIIATQPPAPAPATPPHEQVSRQRLVDELNALPARRSPNATDAHRDGLRATEQLLIDRLTAIGYTPTFHEVDFLGAPREGLGDSRAERTPWRNIIVEIPGRTRPDEILIFAAHFDAVPRSPGADDNGTGTVALLEIARLLHGSPLQRTLRLIFFNLEEVGLVGSRAYVESIENQIKGEPIPLAPDAPAPAPDAPVQRRPPTSRILGMISIDGVGYFTDEPNSQQSPIPETRFFKPPTVGNFIALGGIGRHRAFSQPLVKAMRSAAPKLKIVAVDWLPVAPPDLLRSDHAPFLAAGVPAVILADTANFRSPHYHQPTDTVDTLDLDRYELVVRALVGAAHALAGPVGTEPVSLTRPEPAPSEPAPGPDSPAPAPAPAP